MMINGRLLVAGAVHELQSRPTALAHAVVRRSTSRVHKVKKNVAPSGQGLLFHQCTG